MYEYVVSYILVYCTAMLAIMGPAGPNGLFGSFLWALLRKKIIIVMGSLIIDKDVLGLYSVRQ